MSDVIRILCLADSHLGVDLPTRPRVERRRRGPDFLANHAAALAPALAGGVDVVVHGGDVFDRPRVPASLAHQAYAALLRVADRGVPVFIVPGNHERGRLPHAHLLAHPRVHVFDRPRTFTWEVRGVRLALSGFPYERANVRARFPELLARTGWRAVPASVRLLCVHHCIEGATVGPGDYTFTTAPDVIRGRDLPGDFAAVLSGHIHRRQALVAHLSGRPLAAPVLYPGSIERTSTAEIGESKGYLLVEAAPGRPVRWEHRDLPARPMVAERLVAGDAGGVELDAALRALVAAAPADAVLRVRVEGATSAAQLRVLSSAHVRSYAPATMNVEVRSGARLRAGFDRAHRRRRGTGSRGPRDENLRLEL